MGLTEEKQRKRKTYKVSRRDLILQIKKSFGLSGKTSYFTRRELLEMSNTLYTVTKGSILKCQEKDF